MEDDSHPAGLRVAVVGAGVAGLGAGRRLVDEGHSVVLLDKGRRPGGRLATRRRGDSSFDHGAQYFTARDERVRSAVSAWAARGVVAEWAGRVGSLKGGRFRLGSTPVTRYVGVPGMSGLARHLAQGLEIHQDVRVTAVTRTRGEWTLVAEDSRRLDPFDVVLVTVPAPQAEPLLAERPRLAEATRRARLRPCWAVLARYDRPLDLAFDGAFVEHPVLGWVARNSSKPGRPNGEAWVLHAGPGWSEAHLESEGGEVTPPLLAALEEAVGRELPRPASAESHRWRYALPDPPLDQSCLYDPEAGLGAGGDWCGGPRVEGALLSGWALADRVLAARAEAR